MPVRYLDDEIAEVKFLEDPGDFTRPGWDGHHNGKACFADRPEPPLQSPQKPATRYATRRGEYHQGSLGKPESAGLAAARHTVS